MAGQVIATQPPAISTKYTYLQWGDTPTNITQHIDIKDFSDLIGEPNDLEATTLSHNRHITIAGLPTGDMITFTINYTIQNYQTALAYAGQDLYFRLVFQDGSNYTWEGRLTVSHSGAGVDEVLEFAISASVASEMVWNQM